MNHHSLFEEDAQPLASRPSAQTYGTRSSGFDVSGFLTGVDREPLPETSVALKLLPDAVRVAAERAASAMFLEGVGKLVKRMGNSGTALERRPSVIAHSAKLEVFSAVSGLAWLPWHLADSRLVDTVAAEIENSGELGIALAHFEKLRAVNLFVAAMPADTRESYLRSVAALIRGRKVHSVVLDAELIEWWPSTSFAAACTEIGLRPMFVGIAERSAAGTHSFLSDRRFGSPVVIDSSGKQLGIDQAGAVSSGESTPTARTAAVQRTVPRSAGDPLPSSSSTVPTDPVSSRIDALKNRQAKYRNAGRPGRPA